MVYLRLAIDTPLRRSFDYLPPAEGAVRWNGEDVAGAREAHRARIGWLGMQDALKPALAEKYEVSNDATTMTTTATTTTQRRRRRR